MLFESKNIAEERQIETPSKKVVEVWEDHTDPFRQKKKEGKKE